MAKNEKLSKVHDELMDGKQRLVETFGEKGLENLQLTKEEFEDAKQRLKDYPKAVRERNLEFLDVKKKLNVVLNEKQLHDKLDEAIGFLDDLLK